MKRAFNPTHYLSDTTPDGWSGPVEIQTGPAAAAAHDGETLVWDGRTSILCRTGQLIDLTGHAHTERWNHPIRTERGGDVETTECELCRRPIKRHMVDVMGNWGPWQLADDVEAWAEQLTAETAADPGETYDQARVDNVAAALTDAAAILAAVVRERDAALADLGRVATERDTARRQRDALTDQLDAALDDRDRARSEVRAARAWADATYPVPVDYMRAVHNSTGSMAAALLALADTLTARGDLPIAPTSLGIDMQAIQWHAPLAARQGTVDTLALLLGINVDPDRKQYSTACHTVGRVEVTAYTAASVDHDPPTAAAAIESTAPATLDVGSGTARP